MKVDFRISNFNERSTTKKMIHIGENKALLCKGDYHPAQLYKGEKKLAGYTMTAFEGTDGAVLTDCYNDKVYDAFIHGKNLLDVNKYYGEWANENGGISIPYSGVLYKISDFFISVKGIFKENTQYTFSCNYNIAETTTTIISAQMKYTDGTRSYINFGFNHRMGEGTASFVSTAGKTVKSFSFTYGTTSKVFNGELTEMQIEEGTAATEYEPPLTEAAIKVKCMNEDTKTQEILLENGEPTADIPTFKGTTVIEVESDIAATISGTYKKWSE